MVLETVAIEYVNVLVGQITVTPLIGPGVAGIAVFTETGKVLAALVPQELLAVTVIFPETAVPDVVTVIELVFVPVVMLQPVGKVHVYDEAFATADIL